MVMFVHVEAPATAENFAGGHSIHVDDADAPRTGEYFPAAQATHMLWPTAEEYSPPAHSMHAPEPLTALYFPAKHAVHGPPSGPE